MRLGIQAKLIGLIVGAAVVPVVVAIVAIQTLGYRETVLQKRSMFRNEAVDAARNLRVALERRVENLEDLLVLTDFETALEERLASDSRLASWVERDFLRRMADLDLAWTNAVPDGSLVEAILTNGVSARLRAFQGLHPRFAELIATDSRGALVAATGKTSDYYQGDESWWQRARQLTGGSAWVEGLHWDESARVFSVDVAVPVRRRGGSADSEPIGVVKAVLNTSPLFASLPTGFVGEGVNREIVGADGRRILELGDERARVLRGGVAPALQERLSDSADGSFVARLESGAVEMVGFAPLRLLGRFGDSRFGEPAASHFVLVHQSAAHVLASLRWQTAWVSLAGILLVMVCSAVGLGLGHRDFIVPLKRLRAAARAVAASTRRPDELVSSEQDPAVAPAAPEALIERVDHIRTGDEIESLARDFRTMANRVLRYQRELQSEIDAKTREMENDLATAREFQRALLPRAYPQVPEDGTADRLSLHFNHWYRPASSLGGDFFDILKLSRHQAGIFLADVMGHGTRSALVTAMLRTLHQDASADAGDPARYLAGLNDRFFNALRLTNEMVFASAVYLVADTEKCVVRCATAGHPSPLVGNRRTRTVSPLLPRVKQNPALGLFPVVQYETFSRPLVDEDVFLFFTDGVTDALNDQDEEFGTERLSTGLRASLSADAPTITRSLVDTLDEFCGDTAPLDDVCLLVMEVRARSAVVRGRPAGTTITEKA